MIPKSKGNNKQMIKKKKISENEIEIRRRRKEQLHIGRQPNNVLAKENSLFLGNNFTQIHSLTNSNPK